MCKIQGIQGLGSCLSLGLHTHDSLLLALRLGVIEILREPAKKKRGMIFQFPQKLCHREN